MPLGRAHEQAPHRLERLPAALRRTHRTHLGVAGIHREQRAEVRGGDPRVFAHLRHAALDLGGDHGLAVCLLHAELAPHEIDERMERHRSPEREAVPFLPRGGVADAMTQLAEQPGLADARIADDEHDLAVTIPRALERVEEQAELARAPDERRQPPIGLHVQARPRLARGDDVPRRDRFGLSPKVHLAERARLEVAAHEPMRGVRDHHAARFARLLQARRHVGRVAHGGVVHPEVAADASDHDETGVQPLPRAEADAARRELLPVVLERPGDAERGMDRPARMILVRDRRAEERHDPVPEELVHRALVAMDFREHEVEGTLHEPVDLFGIEALRQRREPGDVDEEDRHLLALALERARRREDLLGEVLRGVGAWGGEGARGRRGQRAAAGVTEPIVRRVRRLARAAHQLEARPAAAAEPRGAGVVVTAAGTRHGAGSIVPAPGWLRGWTPASARRTLASHIRHPGGARP